MHLDNRIIKYTAIQPNDRVVFMHVPKAAGTSFCVILEEVYKEKFFNIAPFIPTTWEPYLPKGLNQFQALAGHFSIGNGEIYEMFDGPFVHLTMFRDPVERVLSAYNYILIHPAHHQHELIANRGLAEIYKNNEAYRFMFKNLQVLFLSGAPRPTRSDLEIAKENLEKYFSIFGFVEDNQWFIDILNKKFGWQEEQKFNNISQYDKSIFSVRDLIAENNELDLELYDYALKLYNKRKDENYYG